MATLARSFFKMVLFIGLFLLSARCIERNGAMPESEALRWLSIAQSLGLHEADDVYIPTMLVLDLLAATLAYTMITKLWNHYRGKKIHVEKYRPIMTYLVRRLFKIALELPL